MSQAQLETDVFIIGGGPAGLAAAIAAREKGCKVAVADCTRPPIDKACGEGRIAGKELER
jgi:flavin-dependent dehydrogenase